MYVGLGSRFRVINSSGRVGVYIYCVGLGFVVVIYFL